MKQKQILFIMTGGTIASVDNGNGLEPALDNFFKPIAEQFSCKVGFLHPFNLDSSQVTPDHWQTIAQLINQAMPQCDGVVITHGTDTMAYTAAGLYFLLRNLPVPVVLTGAQIPINTPGSDGKANVELALQAAMSGLKGILVAFAGRLIRGYACSKTHSDNLIGFESINEPYASLKQQDNASGKYEFFTAAPKKVFLLKAVPGVEPDIIENVVSLGYRRLVIECFGKGGLPCSYLPVIRKAVEQGVRVGITTQCTYDGSDCYVYRIGRDLLETGVQDYKWHTTEYAVADMMFRK